MTRLHESLVGIGVVAAISSVVLLRPKDTNGSWGVQPTAEAQQAIDAYLHSVGIGDDDRMVVSRQLVRASEVRPIFDSVCERRIKAVKAEFVEHFKPRVNFGADLPPRLYVVVIGFDGGEPVRWFYEGRGPKEYREAF